MKCATGIFKTLTQGQVILIRTTKKLLDNVVFASQFSVSVGLR